jgi:LuxR family transcriptional regulator, maltose regulon positive regulatory protein
MSAATAFRRALAPVPAKSPRAPRHRLPFEVAEAKVGVPVLRPGLVSRTALANRLRANTTHPVVTVTAPSGYGKTTLLAQWAARDARPFAWVTVDSRDRDPIVLLRHLAAAVHGIEPLDARVLESLAEPGASIWSSTLPRLGSALAAFPEPLVLVLDDGHLLRARESLEAVSTLAQHLPPGGLLVLAGRHQPKLPVAAIRASGRLFDLGAADLAFSHREGQALLRAEGVDLSLAQSAEIVRECEGWPAALYLAAAAAPESGDGTTSSGARNRAVASYLRSEYLARLRPSAVEFLRRTSILEHLSGPLCDAVLDTHGSARELEKIEHSNLFLDALDSDGAWYRYHRLFRAVLRRELAEREPKLVALLHRRAAEWYEANDDLQSALEHAAAAGDVERVARILCTVALPLYHEGSVAAVEGWLERFDQPDLLLRFPLVALQGSWIHALRGRSALAARWLRSGETALARTRPSRRTAALRPWIAAIRAALCGDGVYQMIADAETALAGLPRESQVRPTVLASLGVGYALLGHEKRADAILAHAAAEATRLGATDAAVLAKSERSLIAAHQNDVAAAERFAHDAHELLERRRLDGYATTAIALAASARASLRRGRWSEARADLTRVEDLEPSLDGGAFPWFALQARIELARAHLALRETQAVESLLADIRRILVEHPYVGALADEVDALERDAAAAPDANGGGAGLTPAELRLLPFLATHLSFREIGEQLFVSRNTIKTQAISVYRKLGVASRSDAIRCATRLGLVDAGAPTNN